MLTLRPPALDPPLLPVRKPFFLSPPPRPSYFPTTGSLIAHELRAKAHTFAPDASVMEVVQEAFVQPDHTRRTQRVAVTDGRDPPHIQHILSQTDVINFLLRHKCVTGPAHA